jgi:hypothetical protein
VETIFQFKTMNAKQRIPLIAAFLPLLLIIGVVFLVVKWIFPAKKVTETKPETMPASSETESRRKEAETSLKTPSFRPIPAEIPVKPAAAPVPAAIATKKIVTQAPPPPPIKKKFVTREDMAKIFHRGARSLTRPAAVAALKKIGFGKTAAYAALSPDGRFSAWLRCSSDGIITWTE